MDLLNELIVKIISFCGWVIILIELFTEKKELWLLPQRKFL